LSRYRTTIIAAAVIGITLGSAHGLGLFGSTESWFEDETQGGADQTFPLIELPATEIEAALRGSLPVPIRVTDEGGNLETVTVQLDDTPAMPLPGGDAVWEVHTKSLPDGPHTVTVVARDTAGNESIAKLVFASDNTPPRVFLREESTQVSQGHTLAVFIRSDAAELSLTFLDKERSLYLIEGTRDVYRALIGIPIEAKSGYHTLEITASDEAGNNVFSNWDVEVAAYDFERGGYISLNRGQTAARSDRSAIDKANGDRLAAYQIRSPDPMWAGTMKRPVEGRKTSEFGRYRSYSDGSTTHHRGTDYAAVTGTPVLAAAAGTVTLAEEQIIYGNVVILDHGHGVSTSYNHLNAITVHVGDEVSLSDQVGEVGSTGQSTGPHLHWGMTVDDVAVNGEQWLDTDFLPVSDEDWFELDTQYIEEWTPSQVPSTDSAAEEPENPSGAAETSLPERPSEEPPAP
jgi:murein DD-endopeptidase MepM/ murein hydrolase activator NlpD